MKGFLLGFLVMMLLGIGLQGYAAESRGPEPSPDTTPRDDVPREAVFGWWKTRYEGVTVHIQFASDGHFYSQFDTPAGPVEQHGRWWLDQGSIITETQQAEVPDKVGYLKEQLTRGPYSFGRVLQAREDQLRVLEPSGRYVLFLRTPALDLNADTSPPYDEQGFLKRLILHNCVLEDLRGQSDTVLWREIAHEARKRSLDFAKEDFLQSLAYFTTQDPGLIPNNRQLISHEVRFCLAERKGQRPRTAPVARDEDTLIGGWKSQDTPLPIELGLHPDGRFFMGSISRMFSLITEGRWHREGDTLVLQELQEYRETGDSFSQQDRDRTVTYRLLSAPGNRLVLERRGGNNLAVLRFTRGDEILDYRPPTQPAGEAQEADLLVRGCHSQYKLRRYLVARVLCAAAGRQGDGESAWLMARMHHTGEGGPADSNAAAVWYDRARAADYPPAQVPMDQAFAGLSFDPAPAGPDSLQGYWCQEGVALSPQGPFEPDGDILIIQDDRQFTYLGAMVQQGHYTLEDNRLELSGVGTFRITEQTPDRLLLKALGYHRLHRGNCSDKVRAHIHALLLDNAIAADQKAVIDVILDAGHDINRPNLASGTEPTPLIQAVKSGRSDLVKRLLELGADANKTDFLGRTPLYYARRQEAPELVALLQAAGAGEAEP